MGIRVDLNTALSMIEPEQVEQNREVYTNIFNEADALECKDGTLSSNELKYFLDMFDCLKIDNKIKEKESERMELIKQENGIKENKQSAIVPSWARRLIDVTVAVTGVAISCYIAKNHWDKGLAVAGLFGTGVATALAHVLCSPFNTKEDKDALKEINEQRARIDKEIANLKDEKSKLPLFSNIPAMQQRIDKLEHENAELKAAGTVVLMNSGSSN